MKLLRLSAAVLALFSPALGRAIDADGLESRGTKEIDLHAEPKATTFNGQTVPPMEDFTVDTIDERLKSDYWLVEFFSPICSHCKILAPTWQTLYELYYTLDPLAGSTTNQAEALNTFTRYYDFHFARVNCVTNADICAERNVGSYPTVRMYKDGKELESYVGAKDLKTYSDWIEKTLETIRPGSRPKGGIKLPEVGASTSPDYKPPPPRAAPVSGTEKPLPSKPKPNANPKGEVKVLTAETFKSQVVETGDPWFVKFYAPWCHHCQSLAPNWVEMARAMKNKLNIGEVNCDIEKLLCKEAGIKSYPTMHFFRNGERVEYRGMRGVGDLVHYAQSAADISDGITEVDAKSFEAIEKKEPVLFVYCYDHATTSEDFAILERMSLALVGRGKLVKTMDKKLFERFKVSTWPRLLVTREGKRSLYTPITPKEMRDFPKILKWMKSVWLPLVPELTSQNSKEIMNDKIVVLGVLHKQSGAFQTALRELKSAAGEWMDKEERALQIERQELRDAKQLKIDDAEDRNDEGEIQRAKEIRVDMDRIERKQVRFAWVDSVFWERWLRTTYGTDFSGGERVIINDQANRRYWDTTVSGTPILPSRATILDTLPKVVVSPPKIPAKSTTGTFGRAIHAVRDFASAHSFFSLGIIVGALLLVYLTTRTRARRGPAGHFLRSDPEKMMGGLLGGGSAGKVD